MDDIMPKKEQLDLVKVYDTHKSSSSLGPVVSIAGNVSCCKKDGS